MLECAAIGVPDPHSGETVKLFIVKKDPNLTVAQVKAHCAEGLTNYKRPKFVEFRDSLPKSNVGKILRKDSGAEAHCAAGFSKKPAVYHLPELKPNHNCNTFWYRHILLPLGDGRWLAIHP